MMLHDVDPLQQWPVIVARQGLPAIHAERNLRFDLRVAVITYLTEIAGEPSEVAVRAAMLAVNDYLGDRQGIQVVRLTADQLAAYAAHASEETS